jgi:serine/threonine protein phosphatase PrpC
MILINHIFDSIKSPAHDKNEDKTLIIQSDKYWLFFVFDGVGSATHAIDAVKISCDFISKNYKNYEYGEKFHLSDLMYNTHLQIIKSKLPEALSTYVAMFISKHENQKISISSMGDSRIYGVSNQYIIQHTKDDSIPNIDNTITKSLGMLKLKDTDFYQRDFAPKESRYLFSSDGFYKLMEKNILSFHQILNFLRLGNVKNSLKKSIINNNADDASYILIEINVQD